jgi:hypothetical protein
VNRREYKSREEVKLVTDELLEGNPFLEELFPAKKDLTQLHMLPQQNPVGTGVKKLSSSGGDGSNDNKSKEAKKSKNSAGAKTKTRSTDSGTGENTKKEKSNTNSDSDEDDSDEDKNNLKDEEAFENDEDDYENDDRFKQMDY